MLSILQAKEPPAKLPNVFISVNWRHLKHPALEHQHQQFI